MKSVYINKSNNTFETQQMFQDSCISVFNCICCTMLKFLNNTNLSIDLFILLSDFSFTRALDTTFLFLDPISLFTVCGKLDENLGMTRMKLA